MTTAGGGGGGGEGEAKGGGGGNFDGESDSSSDWDSASEDGHLNLSDRLLHAESMLLRLRHLIGDCLWEAVGGRLGTDEDVRDEDDDDGDDERNKGIMAFVHSAIQRARVRREKAEAAKNNKRAKVTFKDDFRERGGGGGGATGGKSQFGKRMNRTGKKPFNRCHSSMN